MKVVVFLFGDFPTSEFYVPTFQKTLFQLHGWCKRKESYLPVFREIIVSSSAESHSSRKVTDVSRDYRVLMIYLLTAIGLSAGGSTHLHTNNT